MTQSNEAAERSYHAPAVADMTGNGVLVEVAPGVFKLAAIDRLERENARLREALGDALVALVRRALTPPEPGDG